MIMYNNFDYFLKDGVSYIFAISLGNLGFSESNCNIENIGLYDSINLKCGSESSKIYSVSDFGLTTIFENQRIC